MAFTNYPPEFRKTAEALRDIEREMLRSAADASKPALPKPKVPLTLFICLAAIVFALLLSSIVDSSTVTLACLAVILLAALRAWSSWRCYKEDLWEYRHSQNVSGQYQSLESQRQHLVDKLNRDKHSLGLTGTFWWESGITPKNCRDRLPGAHLPPSDTRTCLLYPLQFIKKGGQTYCLDPLEDPVWVTRAEAEAFFHGGKGAILYRNDAVLASQPAEFELMNLCAYAKYPLTEISRSVSHSNVDEEMKDYREELDSRERTRNFLADRGPYTDEEAFVLGKSSGNLHMEEQYWRERRENRKRAELEAASEHVHYQEHFHNLYQFKYYIFARLLVAEDQVAMIILPREPVDSMELVIRTPDEQSFHGCLTEYYHIPALQVGAEVLSPYPSIRMAAERLFDNPDYRRILNLAPADILQACPPGLSPAEWAYLIWHHI